MNRLFARTWLADWLSRCYGSLCNFFLKSQLGVGTLKLPTWDSNSKNAVTDIDSSLRSEKYATKYYTSTIQVNGQSKTNILSPLPQCIG